MKTSEKIDELRRILEGSDRIVFFGGAGVSTESGIPDFRSETARRDTVDLFGVDPEQILSGGFFARNPAVFYEYLWRFLHNPAAGPNPAHKALVNLEESGKLDCVITQNIDGLHETAGSKVVWPLHGSMGLFHCAACRAEYSNADVVAQRDMGRIIPLCDCGGILKPDVVLYGESLPEGVVENAAEAIARADTLIIAGTSLAVYPAAGLVQLFQGENLVVINLTVTPADEAATLVVQAPVGEVLNAATSGL